MIACDAFDFALLFLAADASDETADNTDGEQEERYQDADAQGTLEECNQRALQVGLVDEWLKFKSMTHSIRLSCLSPAHLDLTLQLFRVGDDVGRVEFVCNVIASEVINHALRLFRLIGILVPQDCVDG